MDKFIYKRFTSLLGIVSCYSLIPGYSFAQEKPNVVIILADDMGYGDVVFNNPLARTKTPNIDKLAESGLCFSDAHAGGAVSIPSRYGLMTGRYFFRVEKKDSYWGYLSPLIEQDRETIGSIMQKAGYATACIGKWHLGLDWVKTDTSKPLILNRKMLGYTNIDFSQPVGSSPNERGFDYSFILPASLDMPPYTFLKNGKSIDSDIILTAEAYPKLLNNTEKAWDNKHVNENDIYWDRGVWWRNGEMSKTFKVEECLDNIVDEGVSFIENHIVNNKEKPFMLYLPLTGPHTPWMPGNSFKNTTELGVYGDFIAQIDHTVFRINEVLERFGIKENTMIIFASDNGSAWEETDNLQYGHLSNGQWRGQKGDAWEGGHHIPLFIKWPAKIKKAQTYPHTVSLIDILATFAEMTEQAIEEKYAEDSFSFYKVINGKWTKPIRDHLIYISSSGKLAITKGDWKFIDCIGSGGFTAPSNPKPYPNSPKGQLYNLRNDPAEFFNLYFKNKEKAEELSILLQTIVKQESSK
ncbi:MAG: arylsulfatase [Tannerellaceae bacterium]|jgi:arylsulfatase A-like enzyme|nr:arylsulfatase [Tannerellaceae bacterium]